MVFNFIRGSNCATQAVVRCKRNCNRHHQEVLTLPSFAFYMLTFFFTKDGNNRLTSCHSPISSFQDTCCSIKSCHQNWISLKKLISFKHFTSPEEPPHSPVKRNQGEVASRTRIIFHVFQVTQGKRDPFTQRHTKKAPVLQANQEEAN